MASLLTELQKAQAVRMMEYLHDTFKREITIIQERANAVIIDENEFNPFSDDINQGEVTYTAIETNIYARIKWLDRSAGESELIFAGGLNESNGTAMSINQDYAVARIKVEKQYEDLVKGATKIIVDGHECQLFFGATKQSIVDLNYTIFYVIKHG